MKHIHSILTLASAAVILTACSEKTTYEMGSYGYDAAFFKQHKISFLELSSPDGLSKIMVIPAYQGRVMTSTADGDAGNSFGWINYKLIESGEINPQFNPVGGEERFWLGPEGGPFSLYFKNGQEQVYENWRVPAAIDTEAYDIAEQTPSSVKFTKETTFTNASDSELKIGIERTVSLLDREAAAELLGTEIPAELKMIAYGTENTITNRGDNAWTKQTGLPSIWLLGMFNPTPTTTVFIPYDTTGTGRIVNDEYFGKVPSDRLIAENGILYFKIDGTYRSKIGLPAGRAKDICGSYDSDKKVLTLVKYTVPEGPVSYVNGQWGPQEDPFAGDVINAYNDGPTDDGTIMGPFYEIETSSPGAELAPGASATHTQYVMHIQGDETQIAGIVQALFGIELQKIAECF